MELNTVSGEAPIFCCCRHRRRFLRNVITGGHPGFIPGFPELIVHPRSLIDRTTLNAVVVIA